jgi:N-acetylglutamate synthase-like GNAT family acetyltransferase
MDYSLRVATLDDKPAIARLIEESARGLSREDYTDAQIEAAIASVFGVDSELIADRTYFIVEANEELVGCGGWSKRKTLFGGDQYLDRDTGELDPAIDAAKIRAFFVHPAFARKGIGRTLLEKCENDAKAAGFRSLELMATLPGLKLYRSLGFEGSDKVGYEVKGVQIEFVPMKKKLG